MFTNFVEHDDEDKVKKQTSLRTSTKRKRVVDDFFEDDVDEDEDEIKDEDEDEDNEDVDNEDVDNGESAAWSALASVSAADGDEEVVAVVVAVNEAGTCGGGMTNHDPHRRAEEQYNTVAKSEFVRRIAENGASLDVIGRNPIAQPGHFERMDPHNGGCSAKHGHDNDDDDDPVDRTQHPPDGVPTHWHPHTCSTPGSCTCAVCGVKMMDEDCRCYSCGCHMHSHCFGGISGETIGDGEKGGEPSMQLWCERCMERGY